MINILFCGNSGVFDGMLTAALSILRRTDTKEPFCFYVFTMDVSDIKANYTPVSDEAISYFGEIIKKYNPGNTVIKNLLRKIDLVSK